MMRACVYDARACASARVRCARVRAFAGECFGLCAIVAGQPRLATAHVTSAVADVPAPCCPSASGASTVSTPVLQLADILELEGSKLDLLNRFDARAILSLQLDAYVSQVATEDVPLLVGDDVAG